jgi:hypothetical protein
MATYLNETAIVDNSRSIPVDIKNIGCRELFAVVMYNMLGTRRKLQVGNNPLWTIKSSSSRIPQQHGLRCSHLYHTAQDSRPAYG